MTGPLMNGTFVPARMPSPTLKELTAEAHLNAAHWHVRQANKLSGGRHRVTSELPVAWYCADCQCTVQPGDACACGRRGNS